MIPREPTIHHVYWALVRGTDLAVADCVDRALDPRTRSDQGSTDWGRVNCPACLRMRPRPACRECGREHPWDTSCADEARAEEEAADGATDAS